MLYTIRNIGVLPGGKNSWATAINNNGEVTGTVEIAAGQQHAFLWTEVAGMKELGTLGGRLSNGNSINDNGEVVGNAYNQAERVRAFIWSATTGMQELPTNDDVDSVAVSINNSGHICGSFQPGPYAALWLPNQSARALGTRGAMSDARGINEAGIITGWTHTRHSLTNVEITNAFITDNAGNLILIGDLNYLPTHPYAINDKNSVVGSYVSFPLFTRAFLWNSTTGFQDIGTLGGRGATAQAINANDIVVGRSYTASSQDRAFVREFGMMLDLNMQVDDLGGWVLNSANDINNKGQIVGTGTYQGAFRGFMLTPINHGGREIIATVASILAGVVAGNSGWVWPFGFSHPIRQPSPNPWPEMSPASRDMMLLIAVKDLAASISDKKIRKAIEEIALALVKKQIKTITK